jgi:MarR family transcriptional regulator, negative regulator of the multidrug operon emrRAB
VINYFSAKYFSTEIITPMPLSQIHRVELNLRGNALRAPPLPLTETLILRVVLVLARDLTQRLTDLLQPAGLTESEYRVLLALHAEGGRAFAGELCAALAQSPANLTRIANSLVKRDLIGRHLHAADRRKMQLVLKPTGTRLLGRLLPQLSRHIAASFRSFSVTQRTRLLNDLKKLLTDVDATATKKPNKLLRSGS